MGVSNNLKKVKNEIVVEKQNETNLCTDRELKLMKPKKF